MHAFDNANNTTGYRWCFDITHLLANPPKAITIDCETVGLEWFKPGFRVLTISITTAPGVSYVMPLDAEYWNNPELKAPDEPNVVLTIGQINTMKEQIRSLLLNPDVAVVGPNWVDDLTEVLTPRGWTRFANLKEGTPVMISNPETGWMGFEIPSALIKRAYDGEMLVWDSKFHQGAYPPDHRMCFRTKNAMGWRAESAKNVAGRGLNSVQLPVSGTYDPIPAFNVPDSWIQLAEAVRADGSIRGKNQVKFKLVKPRKMDRLDALVKSTGSYASIDEMEGNTLHLTLSGKAVRWVVDLLGPAKCLGPWVMDLSAAQKVVWIEEAKHWDGCDAHEGTAWSFSTADLDTENWFQAMAHTTGYRHALRKVPNQRGFNANNPQAFIYSSCVRRTDKLAVNDPPLRVHYKGEIFCVAVSTGAFLMRRKGVVNITGNYKPGPRPAGQWDQHREECHESTDQGSAVVAYRQRTRPGSGIS